MLEKTNFETEIKGPTKMDFGFDMCLTLGSLV